MNKIKCDDCGKFISIKDFEKGAVRKLSIPDNYFCGEDFTTLCIICNGEAA